MRNIHFEPNGIEKYTWVSSFYRGSKPPTEADFKMA